MKLATVLLITGFLHVTAAGLAQKVTFVKKDATLKQVFNQINLQTGYSILWSGQQINNEKLINANFNNTPLDEVLMKCLDKELAYTIENKTIVITVKEHTFFDRLKAALAQIRISGRVVDEEGSSMPGVTIKIIWAINNGISSVIVTNSNGEFSTVVSKTDSIQFSFIGYEPRKFVVSGLPNPLLVTMKAVTGQLDQVQVVGYGTTSRRFNLGNTTTIKADEIAKEPVGNVLMALQGKAPGMSIAQTTGMPGAAPTIKIRGTTSINTGTGTSPLYILDGVPIPETIVPVNGGNLGVNGISALEGINTADIESVDVLKDADATAIYGSKGANGVILITTKKGKAGPLAVNFNAYTGFSRVQHFINLLDVHQYNAMRREALKNDGITATAANSPDLLVWDTTQVHDWQKEYIGETALTNDANVSISGGSGGTTIYANAGYHNQGTVFPGNANDERKSARITVNHVSPNGKLTLNLISGYSISTLNLQGYDLTASIFSAPAYPLYTASGAPNYSGTNGYPLAYTLQPYRSQTSTYNGHATLGYQFIKGLTLKIDAGFNNAVNAQRQTNPLISLNPASNSSGNLATADYKNNTWIAEPQLTYSKTIKKSTFNFLLGTSFQKTSGSVASATGTNYANEALINNISAAGTVTYNVSDSEYAYTSLFGRLNYNYDEKYLANISYRRDGSSRFGPDRRFGNFYALGLVWIFSKEALIQKILPFLSFGKLRGSYGLTGNDQIGDYKYLATYTATSNGYQGATLTTNGIGNADFRWEENRKLEFGLELGAFKDRILGSASFFRNRTDNAFIAYILPAQTGASSYTANFPALSQNQGWEFTLTTTNLDHKSFNWKTTLNYAYSHNKLIAFPGIENTSYAQLYIVGESLNLVKGYVFNGLSNTGVPTYKDLTGNGTVTSDDRIVVGNKDPATAGMSNDFRYKSFTLSFFIDFSRFSNFSQVVTASRSGNLGNNRPVSLLSRWQKPGDELTTNTPKFTTSTATYVARTFQQSDINWTTYNIFRLRNIVFAYNLPYTVIHKISVRNAKVFFQAQNVWTSGDHDNLLDPETGSSTLPPLRTLIFGINFTF